jgi:hypothetical protein
MPRPLFFDGFLKATDRQVVDLLLDWSRLDPSHSRLVRARESSRCARRGLNGSQPRRDLSDQGPLGGLFGAERTVRVDGDLERQPALLNHQANLIAHRQLVGVVAEAAHRREHHVFGDVRQALARIERPRRLEHVVARLS